MRVFYYKQMSTGGEIVSLLTYDYRPNITDPLIIKITEEEYAILLAEIEAANRSEEPETSEDEISAEEALDIILGGDTE